MEVKHRKGTKKGLGYRVLKSLFTALDVVAAKVTKRHWVIALVLLFFAFLQFDSFLIPLMFIVLGALFWLLIRPFPMIGMEMSFVGVVICAALYGAGVGIAAGLLGMFIGRAIVLEFQVGFFYDIIGYFVVGFIASYIPVAVLPVFGVLLSLVYNIFALLFRKITGTLIGTDYIYATTNFLFQSFIFFKLFPLVRNLFG